MRSHGFGDTEGKFLPLARLQDQQKSLKVSSTRTRCWQQTQPLN